MTSHPTNKKKGWWEYYLSPNEAWNQNESWQSWNQKSKLIITTHLLEGEMWIATHLNLMHEQVMNLNLMHEQVMKVLGKNFCDFFMEFAVFFSFFIFIFKRK